jgi:GntR family transcriptional repressor for pyruvate dehydrogenase complex
MPRTKTPERVIVPIEGGKIAESTFEQLMSFVVNGDWAVGQRIPPERDLCEQLGIARTSLREALKAMELLGMVESRVGDGTFVCPRSEFLARPLHWAFAGHQELREILEARIFMESDLASLAAERASKEEIATISEAVERMAEDVAAGRPCGEAEMAFHLGIADAAHNSILTSSMRVVLNQMRKWIYMEMRPAAERLKRHQAIYNAIARGDQKKARSETWQHGLETISAITAFLDQSNERH